MKINFKALKFGLATCGAEEGLPLIRNTHSCLVGRICVENGHHVDVLLLRSYLKASTAWWVRDHEECDQDPEKLIMGWFLASARSWRVSATAKNAELDFSIILHYIISIYYSATTTRRG